MTLSDDETTQLRNYTVARQQVTASVRALKQLAEAQHDAERREHVKALLVKLAEDRFNLAVVGQFKRGKSSLMNAVIGRDLLPTGLLPLTSAITTLCYGPQEQVLLRRKGWSFEQKISFNELADYITERGNPGNEKQLIEARVELPVRFLRRGLHFIDTPGVGSTRQENTATTYGFLPEADAVIFVTSVEAPLSETEQSFLHDIRDHVRKLFIIVNKIDILTVAERDDVLKYIRTGIHTTLGTSDLRLYPVSARQALDAKLNGDNDRLRESGLFEMEAALTTFLAREQGRTFLVTILDRALGLLADIEDSSLKSTDGDPELPAPDIPADRLRETMESLRAVLLDTAEPSPMPTVNAPVSADVQVVVKAIAATQSEQPRGTLRSGTCPICSAQSQTIFDFFAHWQYMLARDELAQRAFIVTHGFCSFHTWQFQQIASPEGVCEGYAPLIETAVAELRQLSDQFPEQIAARVEALLSSTETCAACRVLQETETEQIQQLVLQLATPKGRQRYVRSEGLCLPHLHAALTGASDCEVVQFLLPEQVRHLEEISEDMRTYTLKRDALRRGLLNTQEENAWRRALVQLVGERIAYTTNRKKA
jgi:GTP-binding protein EngB required for normal cell division